jgi:hypothetical protein
MRTNMRKVGPARRGWFLAAASLGAPHSAHGHLLAYLCRYGAHGLVLEGQGVHTYFPRLFALTGAALGAVLVAGLLVGGLGHLALSRGAGLRPARRRSVLDLLLVMAAVQMQVYVAQETVEALAGGIRLDTVWMTSMLVWGIGGQLPIAILAAFGLAWLSTRFDAGLAGLRSLWRGTSALLAGAPLVVAEPGRAFDTVARLAQAAPAALVKRGPPCCFRSV